MIPLCPRLASPRNRAVRVARLALAASLALAATSPARSEQSNAAEDLARVPAVEEAIALYSIWVEEQIAYHGVPGVAVAVVHGGDRVWAAGFGKANLESGAPVTSATPFRLGSVSKLFTATAILELRDAGKLRLEDPVVRHLPWFEIRTAYADAGPITLEHLLTHTSGLPREGPFPYWTTHDFPTVAEVRSALPTLAALHPPGEVYRYSNLGLALLGQVVEAASGEGWADYVERHLLAPLGMAHSSAHPSPEQIASLARAYTRKFPDGSRRIMDFYETRAIAPAAAVVASAEDLARFAAFHLSGVTASGEPLLSAATRKEMRRPHFVYPSWSGGRGLGFGISRRDGVTVVSHGGWIGGHRSELLLVPDRDLAVVALCNADDASPAFFARKAADLIGGAVAAATAPPPRPKRPADPAWARYAGTYTDPWGWEYEVLLLGDDLVVYDHNYPPDDDPDSALVRLTPTDEPHHFTMSDGEPFVFELDDAGRVRRIRRRFEYLEPLGR